MKTAKNKIAKEKKKESMRWIYRVEWISEMSIALYEKRKMLVQRTIKNIISNKTM